MMNHIYNMNCFEGMRNIDDKSIDYAFTSPPYNRKRNDKYSHYEDIIDDYYDFLLKTIEELRRICKKHVIINLQTNYYNKKDIYKIIGTYADCIQNIIIWEKSNPMPACGLNITNAFEYFLVIGDEPLRGNHTYIKNHITTSVNSKTTLKNHKAVMNIDVSDWWFDSFIPTGSTIIDPFIGTGTTAISAIKHGCEYIGYEIAPEYFEYAEQRIKKAYEENINKKDN